MKALVVLMIGMWLSLCAPLHADPALTVLGREAAAKPAAALLGELLDRLAPQTQTAPNPPAVFAAPRSSMLPLESELVPSSEGPGIHRIAGVFRPICVIGNDRISKRWLQRQRAQLQKLGAACILVKVRDAAELASIRALAHPLAVQAVPFDDLARQFEIQQVPVLLMGER